MATGARCNIRENGNERTGKRVRVAVPASITVGNQDFSVKVANIVRGGAMLETTAPLDPGVKGMFFCGTVAAEATVIWKKSGRIGLKFFRPLTDAQVNEQLSRTKAMDLRKAK